MKKEVIFIFGILLISLVSAQVSIVQNPFTINQKVGDTNVYQFTINNSENYPVLDFTFGNLNSMGFNFSNTTIPANSTRTINMTVTPTSAFSGASPQNVQFNFYANIPMQVSTYDVYINQDGFSPNYIPMRVGDTIIFHNQDTIVHNVFSGYFNQNLQPNSTYSYIPQSTGEIDYYDSGWSEYTKFHGVLNVISRTSQEEVHNPNLDFTWNLNLNFYLNPTNITYELIDTNVTASPTSSSQGLIKLTNTGNYDASKIHLSSSNWITFDKNDFDLTKGSQKYVTFTVYPVVSSTNETNKSYSVPVIISGNNIDNQTKNVNVFVSYYEINGGLGSDLGTLTYLQNVYCPAHPCSLFCSPEKPECQANSNSSLNGNQSVLFNGTTGDLTDIKRNLAQCITAQTRCQNTLSQQSDLLNSQLPSLNQTCSDQYNLQKQNQDSQDSSQTVIWLIILFVIIIGCLTFVFYRQRKLKRKQSWTEHNFEYKT